MYQKVKFYTLADFVHVELKAEKERGTIYLFFFFSKNAQCHGLVWHEIFLTAMDRGGWVCGFVDSAVRLLLFFCHKTYTSSMCA